jgi:hypothetical protein
MSDEEENAAGEAGILDNSRRSREQRIADFLGVAGLTLNDIMKPIREAPLVESDVVTDAHRELVIDLKASGCSNEGVAKFFNISLQKCQRLFDWELTNGRQLRTTSVVRGLSVNAIQLGDTSAQIGYLKNQPQEEWGTKHSQKNIEDPPPAEDELKRLSANEAFIAGITAGLSIDTTKFKKAEPRPAAAPKVAPKKQIGYTTQTIRKAKGDQE